MNLLIQNKKKKRKNVLTLENTNSLLKGRQKVIKGFESQIFPIENDARR